MKDFANHILAVAYENVSSVTNLQLQKIMYFAMRDQKNNLELLSEMYDEPFYVWYYGPVIPSIHRKYSGYGSRAIIEEGKRNDKYSIFDNAIIKLLDREVFSLIDESREHSYWLLNEDKTIHGKSNIQYKLEDVLYE
jgi:hypothetical protein